MVPDEEGPPHRYLESAPGCWRLFGDVLAREYSNAAYWEVHQLTVDAYAVQHPGHPSAQTVQSAAIHLGRLYLQLELEIYGRQLADATRALAKRKSQFIWLDPPKSRGSVTVLDVHGADSPEEHTRRVQAWAEKAWSAWTVHHDQVRRWTSGVFNP